MNAEMLSYKLRHGDFIPGYGMVRYFRRNMAAIREAHDDTERIRIWALGRMRLPILAIYHGTTLLAAYDYLADFLMKS